MKPFITPEATQSGKKVFRYQCEGVLCDDLGRKLEGQKLVAYNLPEGHTLQAAWELSFVFESGLIVSFSSACTEVANWQEVGSLNISLTDGCTDMSGIKKASQESKAIVPAIDVVAASALLFEDDEVIVECGLVLHCAHGQEIIISAGISPGSVSVFAPFSAGQLFEPQFPLSACRRNQI